MTQHVQHGTIDVGELVDLIRTTAAIDEPFDAETPLLSTGMVDSFDVVGLLAAFEHRYGVAIDPNRIDADAFDTPAQMRDLLLRSR